MKPWLLCLAILFGIGPALAQTKPTAIDGDTIAIPGEPNMRLVGYDTPETYTPNCGAEMWLGYQAAGRLQRLINSRTVRIERLGTDKYRRQLGRLYVGNDEVGSILIAEGLAVPYDGRSKRVHWAQTLCGLAQPRNQNNGFLPDK